MRTILEHAFTHYYITQHVFLNEDSDNACIIMYVSSISNLHVPKTGDPGFEIN